MLYDKSRDDVIRILFCLKSYQRLYKYPEKNNNNECLNILQLH